MAMFLLADQTSDPLVEAEPCVVPTSGGDPAPVADGDVRFPTWGPEGHAIAYVDTGALRVVDRPGGAPRDLLREGAPFEAVGEHLEWSPGAILVSMDESPTVLRIDGQ